MVTITNHDTLNEISRKAKIIKGLNLKRAEKFAKDHDTKECSRCWHDLPLAMFNKDSKSATGYASQCNECKKIRRENFKFEEWQIISKAYDILKRRHNESKSRL